MRYRMMCASLALTCLVALSSGTALAATCTINDGAKYTNNPNVTVDYTPGAFDDWYAISNYSPPPLDNDWQPIEIPHVADWWLPFWDGKQTVYMHFTQDPDDYRMTECHDSIILDTTGPAISTMSVVVRRGAVCYLPITMMDNLSPKTLDTVRITTMSGATKKTFVDDWRRTDLWWNWRYRCRLPVGTYRIVVDCIDLAGNSAEYRGNAKLRVR
jgi:hypothetical protein